GEALRARGADCVVLSQSRAETALPRRAPDAAEGFDVLIADLYRPSAADLAALRLAARSLVVIDDESDFPLQCTLVINPNLGFSPTLAAGTRMLAGAIPLRAQFANLPPHPIRPQIERLLVCFGGSDPAGLTIDVVGRIAPQIAGDARVSVVLGPAYDDEARLRAGLTDKRFTILRNVADMVPLFTDADVGILGAGTLLYEAAVTGLPSIFVSSTAAQAREAAAL